MGFEAINGCESVVFVYGSLLRGESNHFRLACSRFLGEASTVPLFDLFDMGGFPAIVEGGTLSVRGEVYAVNRDTLCLLDELEEHPVYYRRTQVALEDGSDAMAYVLPRQKARRCRSIVSGNWRERAAR